LYGWQVLLAAESFGDLLSRYKYLYLVSRQDRLLTNDMHKLRDRVARQRQLLVDARETLGGGGASAPTSWTGIRRWSASARATSRRPTAAPARQSNAWSRLERDERGLNDRIEALERARREAEARGAAAGPGTITTADLGDSTAGRRRGLVIYPFGTTTGPNNTRIPRHGIGIKAPSGRPCA